MKPKLLDLFCGAGGASYGYYLAGFEVIGVDISPQPRYPFKFIQAEAMTFPLDEFEYVHASPPCQAYTRANKISKNRHPELIEKIRERLISSSTNYVIENVP